MPGVGCLRVGGDRPGSPNQVVCLNPNDPQTMRVYDANGLYPAVTANEGGGQNRQAVLVIQGDIARGAHFGQNGCGYSEDGISYTLNTLDCPAVVFEPKAASPVGVFMAGQGAAARTIGYSESSAPTLKSTNSGGNTVPSVVYPEITGTICASGAGTSRPAGQCNESELCIVLPFDTTQITSPQNGNNPKYGDPCHPLCSTAHTPSVVIKGKPRKYIIRRLTPLECERLQGYPDGWTAITYKNKPMSDSARYRMCGNSVAIPCVVRVLGGIVAQTQDLVST
jgi:DNA (cytosine-5)-methyltransferase 1